MHKKKKELLEQRKALLDKIDAIFTAVEASADKAETKEQTEQRDLHNKEIKKIDDQLVIVNAQIEARKAQTEQEESLPADQRQGRKPKSAGGDGGADVRSGLSADEHRDLQGFSFVRAFRQMLTGEAKELDGLEGEMHKEGLKELRDSGAPRGNGNLIIPQLVLRTSGGLGSMEQRDLTATQSTAAPGDQGGLTIQTQIGSLIDRLRKKLIMSQMGVTTLGGLQGLIDFPKVIADDQAVERAETAVSAESSVTFSKISLSPRRLPVFAEVSRQLLMQSSIDVEAWLRSDLAFQIAQVMDARALFGNGSGQPFGIMNTVGVGAVAIGPNGGNPAWDTFVDLETAVAALDADLGSLGYVINTKTRGKLKKTLVAANTAGLMIWDKQSPDNPLNEHKVGVTNLMPSNLVKGSGTGLSGCVYGNFNDALMGQWGGLEFLINPYSRDTEGLIRINCWTFYDFIVRRVESFAVCKDIVTV